MAIVGELQGAVRYVRLTCTKPDLHAHFGVLCEEIATRLNEESDTVAESAIVEALRRWRELVTKPKQALSAAEIQGLWGELHVLNLLLATDNTAIKYWVGPGGAVHDFIFSAHALEVKTLLNSKRSSVTISRIDQLEPPPQGPLYLAVCRLYSSPAGRSLRELFDAAIASAIQDEETETRLATYGLSSSNLAVYDESRYSLISSEYYAVRDGFPRITKESFPSGNIPPGTHNLTYDVDLSHAVGFRLTKREEDELIQRVGATGA